MTLPATQPIKSQLSTLLVCRPKFMLVEWWSLPDGRICIYANVRIKPELTVYEAILVFIYSAPLVVEIIFQNLRKTYRRRVCLSHTDVYKASSKEKSDWAARTDSDDGNNKLITLAKISYSIKGCSILFTNKFWLLTSYGCPKISYFPTNDWLVYWFQRKTLKRLTHFRLLFTTGQ